MGVRTPPPPPPPPTSPHSSTTKVGNYKVTIFDMVDYSYISKARVWKVSSLDQEQELHHEDIQI